MLILKNIYINIYIYIYEVKKNVSSKFVSNKTALIIKL